MPATLFATHHETVHLDIASKVISIKAPLVAKKYLKNNATEVFMELINNSDTPRELIAATSPVASQIQLHKTIDYNGKRRMQKINSITIKKDSEKELQPGGLHVMLIGLKSELVKNNSIPIILIFNDGSWKKVQAKIN